MVNRTPQTRQRGVYRKEEFKAFLETIRHGQIPFWSQIAEAIGVDRDTIAYWKTLPEAQQAISEGLAYALEQMSVSGKRDWRQWHEKAKMLGGRTEQIQINFFTQVLNKYGATEGEGVSGIPDITQITSRSSQSSP